MSPRQMALLVRMVSRSPGKNSEYQKLFLTPGPNHLYNSRHPVPPEGAFAIVTNAGRAAVDADGAEDEST